MTEEVFGFGAREKCLMEVGIPCEECIWEEACRGNEGIDEYYEELDEL